MAMRENRKHSAHCRLYLCAWCATSQRGGGRYSTHKPLALHLYSLNTCHMVYLVFCRVRGEVTGPPQHTGSASRPQSLHILLSYHFTRSINMFHLLQLKYAHVPSFNGEMQSSRHRQIEIMPYSQQDRQRPPPYSDPSP